MDPLKDLQKFVSRVKIRMTIKIGNLKTSPYHQQESNVVNCYPHAFSRDRINGPNPS
jgi:hypothetical protein